MADVANPAAFSHSPRAPRVSLLSRKLSIASTSTARSSPRPQSSAVEPRTRPCHRRVPASAAASASASSSSSSPASPDTAYMGTGFRSNGAVGHTGSSTRNFFSRFSLPIRTRARHVADFHISPEEPHRNFSAGDVVHGSVNLTIVKPVRITHLTVSLHGFVRAFKGPAIAERELTNPILTGSSSAQYHGNGCASLFQDEQVLAGEGRLDAAKYEFRFELRFPEKGLPSSIDFERGTISYMITATLTRPTTISPTTSCDRKISLVEKIDIGIIPKPRTRTIYLEPISKRARRRKQAGGLEKPHVASDANEHGSDRESTVEQSVASEDAAQDLPELQRSPVQQDLRSEISGESGLTSGSNLSDRGADLQAATALAAASSKLQAVEEKTITASVELLRGGALAGDLATVRITVQHIKRLKSMHGVVVTIYRQGRIDTAPPASLFGDMLSKDDARNMQKDDYYPRSRTGLGGLSLSSATSQSVFRKDLSQTVIPLIVDPVSLETVLTASVKIPEDAFPTIQGVPGDMISFRYFVEVILDLGGRMSSHLLSGGNSQSGGYNPGGSATLDGGNIQIRGGNVIDTDRLRREKGVVSQVFELMLGTVDSSRGQGKRRSSTLRTRQLHEYSASQEEIASPCSEDVIGPDDEVPAPPEPGTITHATAVAVTATGATIARQQSPGPLRRQATRSTSHPVGSIERDDAPAYVPPPQVTDESGLSDKERVRRQEERLLPSQPPQQPSEAGPSGAMTESANIYDADSEPADGAAPTAPLDQEPQPRPAGHTDEGNLPVEAEPSAPTLEDINGGQGETDDKQELERQRLLHEASAPPEFPDDYEAGPSNSSAPGPSDRDHEPSAPVLTEEDEYGGNYSYGSEGAGPQGNFGRREPLPKYER